MEVHELDAASAPPRIIAAASARAFAALKLFRLFSRCPKGNASIPAFSAPPHKFPASLSFPADTVLFGEPLCDFLPPEPADDDRGFTFSAMAPGRAKLGQILHKRGSNKHTRERSPPSNSRDQSLTQPHPPSSHNPWSGRHRALPPQPSPPRNQNSAVHHFITPDQP